MGRLDSMCHALAAAYRVSVSAIARGLTITPNRAPRLPCARSSFAALSRGRLAPVAQPCALFRSVQYSNMICAAYYRACSRRGAPVAGYETTFSTFLPSRLSCRTPAERRVVTAPPNCTLAGSPFAGGRGRPQMCRLLRHLPPSPRAAPGRTLGDRRWGQRPIWFDVFGLREGLGQTLYI